MNAAQEMGPRIGESRPGLWVVAVLLLAALLVLIRLGDRALWGPEGRWAEITREMRLTGNYFWPTINGAVYYDKPLLSYWLIAGAASLTGHLNELAARLPSALAGLLGVALLVLLARCLYGLPTALVAGLVLATSYSYVYFSRLASADIETVAGILAALALFVGNERQAGWWLVPFWATMALTSLTKGLAGFAVPLLVISVYSLGAHGWPVSFGRTAGGALGDRFRGLAERFGWLVNWKTLPAVAIAALLYFLPFVLSYSTMHSNMGLYKVFRENVERFFLPFDHKAPIYVYLYKIFPLVAPWSLFLPAALVQAHSRPRDKNDFFALCYFWATFVFFTLAGSRRDYYLLPILPAAALLIARLFMEHRETLSVYARRLMNAGFVAMVLLVAVAGALALLPSGFRPGPFRNFPTLPAQGVFTVFWVLQLAAVGYAFAGFRRQRILASASVVAYLGLLFLFVFAFPGAERYRGEKEFAHGVRKEIGGRMDRLILYRVWGPGLLFYLSPPSPVAVYGGGTAIGEVIEKNPGYWIISHRRELGALPDGAVAEASQAFVWTRTPHLSTEYVLLRPRSVTAVQEENRPDHH